MGFCFTKKERSQCDRERLPASVTSRLHQTASRQWPHCRDLVRVHSIVFLRLQSAMRVLSKDAYDVSVVWRLATQSIFIGRTIARNSKHGLMHGSWLSPCAYKFLFLSHILNKIKDKK